MKILWWRVLIAGVVAENAYGAFLLLVLGDTSQALAVTGLVGAFCFLMLGGLWVGRAAESHETLHGALVSAVAIAFYFLLATVLLMAGPADLGSTGEAMSVLFSPLALLNHGLKIIGGSTGGYLASTLLRRRRFQAS